LSKSDKRLTEKVFFRERSSLMEAKAVVRHVRMSPRKMRVIADLVRGKRVEDAMALLKLMPKKGAVVIRKLLISAVANAEQKGEVDVDQLLIRDCNVDNGPILKRWMPRSMGRANRIQRRTSHVTVTVQES
jgi:large subunit ribosomal protein L22